MALGPRTLPGATRQSQDGGPSQTGEDWRLLTTIAHARWGAVALAVFVALWVKGPVPGAPWSLLVPAGIAAIYNSAIALQHRLPRLPKRWVAAVSVAGDFAWVTAAAALALGPNESTAVGYVVVGLESALMFGWTGGLTATCGGVVFTVLLGLYGARVSGQGVDIVGLAIVAATIAVASTLAALASSELHAQRQKLAAQAALLAWNARSDHLTGLLNHEAFEEAVRMVSSGPYGLLLIDIDGTRWTNSVFGHLAGDDLIHAVAGVLAAIAEPGVTVARLSEDKFGVLLPDAVESRTTEVAEYVRAAMHGIAVSSGQLRVSVGCALGAVAEEAGAVLSRADEAVYAAKGAGGDRVVVYGGPGGEGRLGLQAAVESVLADAQGLYTVYQPIVRLADANVVGWEALARPRDWPAGSSVEALFLTAHRMGRGRDLDWRCRRTALEEGSRLDGPLFLNVNIGAIVDPVHGVDQMQLVCDWAEREPGSVVLELTERDALPDPKRLHEILAEYRQAGFRIALDDVGQGHTTLELLLAARPEFVKLARELIQTARSDERTRIATRGLVGLARDIGSTVIAEGIEEENDRRTCISLEMELGQGWLFGRPQPASVEASLPTTRTPSQTARDRAAHPDQIARPPEETADVDAHTQPPDPGAPSRIDRIRRSEDGDRPRSRLVTEPSTFLDIRLSNH